MNDAAQKTKAAGKKTRARIVPPRSFFKDVDRVSNATGIPRKVLIERLTTEYVETVEQAIAGIGLTAAIVAQSILTERLQKIEPAFREKKAKPAAKGPVPLPGSTDAE